jgi:hypothetical protein
MHLISRKLPPQLGSFSPQFFYLPFQEKRAFIEAARTNGSDFTARHNFMLAKAEIETTKAFSIIKRMPKGQTHF